MQKGANIELNYHEDARRKVDAERNWGEKKRFLVAFYLPTLISSF
jgi:hypothetical protein